MSWPPKVQHHRCFEATNATALEQSTYPARIRRQRFDGDQIGRSAQNLHELSANSAQADSYAHPMPVTEAGRGGGPR